MAGLVRSDHSIAFRLGPMERVLAAHFSAVEMPIASLVAVEVVEDVWTKVRGVRPPFTWSKDRLALGTRRGLFGKDFTAVYGLGAGICVEFHGGEWARFVATLPCPSDTAALLRG